MMKRVWKTLACLALVIGAGSAAFGADWPTNRGNAARTGAADNLPGPKAPKVAWVYESNEHFIAAPVPGDKALYVSALGAFNTAGFYALSYDAKPADRVIYKKSPPFLKQAMVCPPAVVDGKLVFGDGMHQTDGAALHCIEAESGRPLWELPVPGTLVHLEGAPTVADGKVYIGGGNAGVICVDMNRLTLNGQDTDLAAAQQAINAKWKELNEAYEKDKKKDPDFAIPPSDDSLPKPQPRKLWQVGQDKLHVDASVAVVGNRVLAASAGLDLEKVGDRAMLCLDAATGATLWRTPLPLNPWAGPSVAKDTVVIGCSSIRFDPKDIPNGKGDVVAMDLATGQIKWKKEVPGGVISPIALVDDLAICTATDGKVRALKLADGQIAWEYDGKAAFFAGPAVGGGVVYVADLKGVVHALALKDGQRLWTLDLAADPGVKAPGMVYGSPALRQGKLYLGTCNLESGQQKTVVVCIQ
jgi:outer membrane protein assembly factor BamB